MCAAVLVVVPVVEAVVGSEVGGAVVVLLDRVTYAKGVGVGGRVTPGTEKTRHFVLCVSFECVKGLIRR